MGYAVLGPYPHRPQLEQHGVDVYVNPLGSGGAAIDLSTYGVLGGQLAAAAYAMSDFEVEIPGGVKPQLYH
jgi:hypothetical protein